MTECNCGASTAGKWADKHTEGCASLAPIKTTGVTDVEWLDAKVVELSEQNEALRRDLAYAYRAINAGFVYGTFDFSILKKTAQNFVEREDVTPFN